MFRSKSHFAFLFVLFVSLLTFGITAASSPSIIGGKESKQSVQSSDSQSLSQVVSEFGKISLSIDGLGTVSSFGQIQVKKPEGATVRKAYLLAATTGFTYYKLKSGDIQLQGNPIVWEREVSNSIYSFNYWSDVTSIVKPIVEAAPSGTIGIRINENNTLLIDGEILVVIFDDPNQTTDNTILLYFGAQNVDGDRFNIDFGNPIDKNDTNLRVDYSLGISYGCIGSCGNIPVQYSRVDVNGNRLTTSAGGQDDGALANGALITVGGLGDSNNNPSNPYATPTHYRGDDELYDLKPFIDNGQTSIQIETLNPSDDDNILFASVFLATTRSIGTIDVDISLYNNPTSSADRAKYENIINFFADGVFESTNGAHKLGTVTFHPSRTNESTADIIWENKCHPSAWPGGIAEDGMHINMCDIFQKKFWPDQNYLKNFDNQRQGGYTLAHEWGHYYYKLFDEYVGNGEKDNEFYQPHSDDKEVKNSIMNKQYKAHTITGDHFKWLNFSVPKNDTKKNAQYRVYGATAWEVLTRPPSEDPRNGERVANNDRIYYQELSEVKPANDKEAPIDLPGPARSSLRIIWTEPSATTSNSINSKYEVQLTSTLGQNISYPDPIVLLAFVHNDAPITDMNVSGFVQLPNGQIDYFLFADDGIPPDEKPRDGIYSAIYGYDLNGIYTFGAEFDNYEGDAKYIYSGFLPSAAEEGDIPMPDPIPISDSFHLTKQIQVSVSHVSNDDYANYPAGAKILSADNKPLSGKIDYPGDKDVFRLVTLDQGPTFVRISNLALGMDPHIRIIGSNGSTVLFDENYDESKGDYLFLSLDDLPPNSTIFVEVSDISTVVSGGLYDVSAGLGIASDSVWYFMNLPYVIK